jgi:hypothetical protein
MADDALGLPATAEGSQRGFETIDRTATHSPERLIAPPGKHSIVMYDSPLAVQDRHHRRLPNIPDNWQGTPDTYLLSSRPNL